MKRTISTSNTSELLMNTLSLNFNKSANVEGWVVNILDNETATLSNPNNPEEVINFKKIKANESLFDVNWDLTPLMGEDFHEVNSTLTFKDKLEKLFQMWKELSGLKEILRTDVDVSFLDNQLIISFIRSPFYTGRVVVAISYSESQLLDDLKK